MSSTSKNHGMRWTDNNLQELQKLANGNTPTRLIANKLGRSEPSVRGKAREMGVSLKPTNQSPYNRKKG